MQKKLSNYILEPITNSINALVPALQRSMAGGFLFLRHSAKNNIPQHRAYPKTFFGCFVVVEVMVAPEGFHEFWRGKCMNGIVHGTIDDVTKKKTREKCQRFPAHNVVNGTENNNREDEAGHRWHE